MFPSGVSVWFACKLCKSFFLNADDFAYHKKKSHVQEFRTTKFIVFEEQTTPPASPPENWVSFLSPKKEKRIHKIISIPSPPVPVPVPVPALTNTRGNLCNERIQLNQNQEFIEADLESSKVFTFNERHDDESGDADEVAPANYNLTDEHREKHFPLRIKPTLTRSTTNRLKTRKREIRNPESLSNNILQNVIQSRKNPCVYLKKLKNLKTVQNTSSHSQPAVHSLENDKSNTNDDDSTAITAIDSGPQAADHLEVEVGSKKQIQPDFFSNNCNSNSLITVPLSINRQEDAYTTDFNLHHVGVDLDAIFKTDNNSYDINADVFEEIITTPNQDCENKRNTSVFQEPFFISESILPNAEVETETETLKASSNSVLYKCKFCCKKIKSESFQKHVKLCKNRNSNKESQSDFASNSINLIQPDPTTEVSLNYNCCDVSMEVVKTEYATDGNEDREFSYEYEDHDPFESESQSRLLAEDSWNVDSNNYCFPNNFEETQAPQGAGYHCTSCKKHFIHLRDIKTHNRKHHETQDGKRRFECPHPKCIITTSRQDHLKRHLKQVHSNTRPFKCPHPNCKMFF